MPDQFCNFLFLILCWGRIRAFLLHCHFFVHILIVFCIHIPSGSTSQKFLIILIGSLIPLKVHFVYIPIHQQTLWSWRIHATALFTTVNAGNADCPLFCLNLKFPAFRVNCHVKLASTLRAQISGQIKVISDPVPSPLCKRGIPHQKTARRLFPDQLMPQSLRLLFLRQ